MKRPVFRVIPGQLVGDLPSGRPPDLARLAQTIVAAAQAWTAIMMEHHIDETLDLSTEAGKVTLILLDSVMDYEYRLSSPIVMDGQKQGPATLL